MKYITWYFSRLWRELRCIHGLPSIDEQPVNVSNKQYANDAIYLHCLIHVQLLLSQARHHLFEKELFRFLFWPPQHLDQHLHAHRFKHVLHIFKEINSKLLHLFALGPRPAWPKQSLLLNRLKPNLLHPPFVVLHIVPWPANLLATLTYRLHEIAQWMLWAWLRIHELEWEETILKLKIAARSEVVVSLLDDGARVGEAGQQSPSMNVVESTAIVPIVFCVGDLKLAVHGDVVGLDRGQVCASDAGIWVLFG